MLGGTQTIDMKKHCQSCRWFGMSSLKGQEHGVCMSHKGISLLIERTGAPPINMGTEGGDDMDGLFYSYYYEVQKRYWSNRLARFGGKVGGKGGSLIMFMASLYGVTAENYGNSMCLTHIDNVCEAYGPPPIIMTA